MAKVDVSIKLHTTVDGDLVAWRDELVQTQGLSKHIKTAMRILKKMMESYPARDFHVMAEESRQEWYRLNGGGG